ncbi:rhodopsin-like [Watersipora subatra]|uniref:rhodopsin-like n=1 Tax=Watersipora subatra TaxID=2589382 RepID=UPI00355B7A1F
MNGTGNWTGTDIPSYTTGLVAVYFILATITGVALNLMTIFALAFGRNINKEVRIQLINLAVADMVMAAFFPTSMMTDNILYFPFQGSVTWCTLSIGMSLVGAKASILSTAAIGLERVIVLYVPLRSTRYGKTGKCVVVAVIWLIAIVPEALTVAPSTLMVHPNGNTYCEIGLTIDMKYYQWLDAAQHTIPTVIILLSYTLIAFKLCIRKRSDIVREHSTDPHSKAIFRLQIMLAVDALLTLIAWLPRNFYFAIFANSDAGWRENTLGTFIEDACLAALSSTNAFCTPIVYLIFNKYFRMDVKLLFQRLPCYKSSTKTILAKQPNKVEEGSEATTERT